MTTTTTIGVLSMDSPPRSHLVGTKHGSEEKTVPQFRDVEAEPEIAIETRVAETTAAEIPKTSPTSITVLLTPPRSSSTSSRFPSPALSPRRFFPSRKAASPKTPAAVQSPPGSTISFQESPSSRSLRLRSPFRRRTIGQSEHPSDPSHARDHHHDQQQLKQEEPKPDLLQVSDSAESNSSIGTNTTGEVSWSGAPTLPGAPTTTKQKPEAAQGAGSPCSTASSSLFREKMDIVAFQEWPLSRRTKQQTPAVETIATQLGRSPILVSFRSKAESWIENDDDEDDDEQEILPPPVQLRERIQTGLWRSSLASAESCASDKDDGDGTPIASCSFLNAIESTLSNLTCME